MRETIFFAEVPYPKLDARRARQFRKVGGNSRKPKTIALQEVHIDPEAMVRLGARLRKEMTPTPKNPGGTIVIMEGVVGEYTSSELGLQQRYGPLPLDIPVVGFEDQELKERAVRIIQGVDPTLKRWVRSLSRAENLKQTLQAVVKGIKELAGNQVNLDDTRRRVDEFKTLIKDDRDELLWGTYRRVREENPDAKIVIVAGRAHLTPKLVKEKAGDDSYAVYDPKVPPFRLWRTRREALRRMDLLLNTDAYITGEIPIS